MSTGAEKIAAAGELRNFANRIRNVLAVADDLDKLGGIENARAGLNAAKLAFEAQQKTERADLEAERAKIGDAIRKAELDAVGIRDAAAAVTVKAEKDAADIITKAKASAEAIDRQAAERKRALTAEIAKHEAARDKAKAEAEAAARLRDEINADLERMQTRLGRKVA